jgi:putative protein kinase ArgK-like GTPase of G3E family
MSKKDDKKDKKQPKKSKLFSEFEKNSPKLQQLFDNFLKEKGYGPVVLTGSPGTGKSSFIEQKDQFLEQFLKQLDDAAKGNTWLCSRKKVC